MIDWVSLINFEGIAFFVSYIACVGYWSMCPLCPCMSITQLNAEVGSIKKKYGYYEGWLVFTKPVFIIMAGINTGYLIYYLFFNVEILRMFVSIILLGVCISNLGSIAYTAIFHSFRW